MRLSLILLGTAKIRVNFRNSLTPQRIYNNAKPKVVVWEYPIEDLFSGQN